MSNILTRIACDGALRRLAEGESDALEIIYDKLGRRIFLLALSILNDPHAAEDIMQDTFVRLLQSRAVNYAPGSNSIAYILTVTRNLALNALPRRAREIPSEISDDATPHFYSPEDQPLSELSVFDILNSEERQIVLLKLEYGMKHRDIADLLGISRAACEKKYSRATAKMRNYYKKKGD